MVETTNPHRGFDYQTTADGESVPTKHDRDMARELRERASAEVVGWSGTFERIVVNTEKMSSVLKVVGEKVAERPAEVEVTAEQTDGPGNRRVLIDIDR